MHGITNENLLSNASISMFQFSNAVKDFGGDDLLFHVRSYVMVCHVRSLFRLHFSLMRSVSSFKRLSTAGAIFS